LNSEIEIVIENGQSFKSAKHTRCLACLQACNQHRWRWHFLQWLQEKTMRSRRGQATKPAGKHNQPLTIPLTPHLPLSILHRKGGCSPTSLHLLAAKMGHSSSILVVWPKPTLHLVLHKTHNPPPCMHNHPPYTMSPIAVPLSLFFNLFSYWFSV